MKHFYYCFKLIQASLLVSCLTIFTITSLAAASEKVTTFQLNNGLNIIVIEDHLAPIVTHMIWYQIGAADEPVGKSGIAHFLEHLLFKGTKTVAAGEFSQIIAENGGIENAFTGYDYTAYYQRIAIDHLPLMMMYEADRMQGLKLTEQDVKIERNVVLTERNLRIESDPESLFSEHQNTLLFINHPYSVPIIGWQHEIKTLTQKDAFEFYKNYYVPNNAVLIVVGDVNPKDVFALAQRYYGNLVPSTTLPPRIRPILAPPRAPVHTVFADPRIRQPYIVRTYRAPNRHSGDQKTAAALTILAALFGNSGITSFMSERLHLDKKVSIYQSAYYNGLSYNPQSFTLYAIPTPDTSLAMLEAEIDSTIAEFLQQKIDKNHLERIKTQIRAREFFTLDNQFQQALNYGKALSSGLNIQDVQAWPDILQTITVDDILQAAQILFNTKASVTAWLIHEDKIP